MAVLGRLLIASAERLDLPDLLSIDSFTAGDFKFLLKALMNDDKPFVLKGLDIINPEDAVGSQNVSVKVAESVVFYPGSNVGPFFHGLEEGNPNAQPLVPELRKNATNYVYATMGTFETSRDTRAFWDPDLDGGDGGEFTQDINTESVLQVEINVSVSSFPNNTIPIAIIKVGPAVIETIEDARDMMFRLGAGGISPDPFSRYNFPNDPSSLYARQEPPTEMSSALDPNPFQGGDKNFGSLKEWMDVVMTKLAELGGTTFWYEDAATLNLLNIFLDSLGTAFVSKGFWDHSTSTPGQLAWSEDIKVKRISDPREILIRAGNKTLADNETMYLGLVREAQINAGNVSVEWFNGLNYVNGVVGAFENVSKGDWIKKTSDSNDLYLRVEEFYATDGLAGGVTSPILAKSIKLSAVYAGVSQIQRGVYSKGIYTAAEVDLAVRGATVLQDLGGDLMWLATRQDTVQNVSDVTTTSLLLVDITEADGVTAKVTSTSHGLVDGDRVTITDSAAGYNGTYIVQAEDADIFYINTADNGDELGVANAYYAIVTTASVSTVDGLLLESANHNFKTNDTVTVAGTTNYNGAHEISLRSNTTFQIPIGSGVPTESTGTAALARLTVRSDLGNITIVQGEQTGIGVEDNQNIRQFIGMASSSDTHPTYNIPPAYNTLDGTQDYNGEVDDNLTVRISKLTAMMADKAQDKTVLLAPSGYITVDNVVNGSARDITFTPAPSETPTLDIVLPSSANNNDITLNGTLSLEQNEVAYVQIDRNASQSFANLSFVTIVPIEDVPLEENTLVVAIRLGTDEVWLWDGFLVSAGITPVPGYLSQVIIQDRNAKLIEGGTWSWDSGTGDLISGDTANIQVMGLSNSRNIIWGQTINLAADGDVAHIEINRSSGPASARVVSVDHHTLVSSTLDTFIIARRVGGDIILGTGTERLLSGQSMTLNQTTSDQNLTYTGAADTSDLDPNYSSTTTITQGNSLTTAIGDLDAASGGTATALTNLRAYTGADDASDTTPDYSSDIRGAANESLEARVGTLTDSVGDGQEDRSAFLRSVDQVTWTGTQIEFTTDLVLEVLNTKSGTKTVHSILLAGSPIVIADGEVIYIEIDRTAASESVTAVNSGATPIPAQVQADKDIFILFERIDESGAKYLYMPFNKQVIAEGASFKVGEAGGGGGIGTKSDFLDPISATLPTGASVNIDGIAGANGDLVLYSNLSSGNNRVYELSGVGSSIVWTAVRSFSGQFDPTDGDSVRVERGDSFAEQLAIFDGTDFLVNDVVRYFDGISADFWEMSSIKAASIANNTTGNIFSVTAAGSENIVVHFSLVRGANQETGEITITNDGTSAALTVTSAVLVDAGVTFAAAINGADVELNYTSDNSTAGTMRYFTKRWANAAGGPTGIPSYSASPVADVIVTLLKDNTNNGDTLSNLNHIFADSTTAIFTLNLPASPSLGDRVRITDHVDAVTGGSWATNNITIGRNASTIDSAAVDFTLDIDGGDVEFIYNGTTWRALTHG